ncbi:hypothetical protein GE253_23195 [Niveispirillum sp. SYP-B3756]|uniref:type II toxin-antitoxin system ParD family antitoxin n=1 Tax=Niveispirillum sp. SYP-B3756 TaxID=2662178 RepID=UPI0012923127|nr:type II toxin-antitoxin system ParD family antitoxin [Niveispirillum sp. SYP-B3756]MQP68229.1 hypothetical protein [Niveispirillum sp. SYP-B3756]
MSRNNGPIPSENSSAPIKNSAVTRHYNSARDDMRAALIAGEVSGNADGFDIEAFIARKRAEYPTA